MKIVIHTQDQENYATHNWDGEGEAPQRWKFKGGDVFIVEGVTTEQAVDSAFWAEVEAAVTTGDNDYFVSSVISSELVDDCEYNRSFCAEWDAPIVIAKHGDAWVATKREINDHEYGQFNSDIIEKWSSWQIERGGIVENTYYTEYLKEDGSVVTWDGKEIPVPVFFRTEKLVKSVDMS